MCNLGFGKFFLSLLEINAAISGRIVDQLKNVIELVEKKRYIGRLKKELAQAKKLLASLERIEK